MLMSIMSAIRRKRRSRLYVQHPANINGWWWLFIDSCSRIQPKNSNELTKIRNGDNGIDKQGKVAVDVYFKFDTTIRSMVLR